MAAGLIEGAEDFTVEVDQAFDMRIAGVNHFTWMLKAEHEGRDVMPLIAEKLGQLAAEEGDGGGKGSKALFNFTLGHTLYQAFGYIPVCVAHTKEYLPFWQGLGQTPEAIPPLAIWETEDRYDWHASMWQQVDEFISGQRPMASYMTTFGPDHATDVIENMVGSLGKPFYINTSNNGAVTNMADDAYLELLCDVDMKGPKPRPVGEMPRGLRGMQEIILDTHELTAEAAATCDHKLLRRAMLTDPLINSIADADAIIRDLLEAEKEALPAGWFE